jgi:hypothetical protein
MKIVLVVWLDASFYGDDYYPIGDDFVLEETRTAGFLISDDDEKVVIAQDIADDTVTAVTVIPKSQIIKMKVK